MHGSRIIALERQNTLEGLQALGITRASSHPPISAGMIEMVEKALAPVVESVMMLI